MRRRIQISAAEAMTPVGLTAAATAAAVRAKVNRVEANELYPSVDGDPLLVATLPDADGALDPLQRMLPAAVRSVDRLLESFETAFDVGRPCHLLLGAASEDRSGALCGSPADPLPMALAERLAPRFGAPAVQVFTHGHASAAFALDVAMDIVQRDPRSVCIVGAVDSLLDEELIEELEEEERIAMAGAYPHGLCPSEAVALLAIECERAPCPRPCLATVEAVATASEPHPYYDPVPTMADGLALVCREALREANVSPAQLDTVLLDMDGEHHRAHEWALVQSRCLAPADSYRLVHPADSYGSIGAASGVAMLALVSSARAWLDGTNLILMSDDEGPRGGVVLRRQHQGH